MIQAIAPIQRQVVVPVPPERAFEFFTADMTRWWPPEHHIGSAPIEGRISGIVDIPNACCSLYLPTGIFDFDVRPTMEGPQMADRGSVARTS